MLGKCTTAVHELLKFRDTATVDQILNEEDSMYFNVLKNQNIPDTGDNIPDLSAKSSALEFSIAP